MGVLITGEATRAGAALKPALEIATMDGWWSLTRRRPEYRRASHTVLKDYGYMRLLDLVGACAPGRLLEFGHGFNATLLSAASSSWEVHGLDDDTGMVYFPTGEAWEAKYRERIVEACPRARLHRGLLGREGHGLEEGSFDLIASVSVVEELTPADLERVVADASRLLRAGGAFVGTCDVPLGCTAYLGHLISACERAGLAVGGAVEPLDAAAWNTALIESPTVVMVTYQMAQPEERVFGGHWGTAWFVAMKEG